MGSFETVKIYIYLILLWFAVMLLFGFMGCSQVPKQAIPEKEDARTSIKDNLAWGDKPWTEHLLKQLDGKNFLSVTPADFKDWCPNFPELPLKQRAEFYAQLVSIMAKRESGFKPDTKFQEAFSDSKGKPVISRGLMQISIESANSYGCGFKDATELHDPLKNLSCSVKIIERWIERDRRLGGKLAGKWQGCARYWSVCRSVSKSYPVVTDYTKNLAICK